MPPYSSFACSLKCSLDKQVIFKLGTCSICNTFCCQKVPWLTVQLQLDYFTTICSIRNSKNLYFGIKLLYLLDFLNKPKSTAYAGTHRRVWCEGQGQKYCKTD